MDSKSPIFKRNNVATLIPDSNVGRFLRSGVDLVGRWFHGGLISDSFIRPQNLQGVGEGYS